MTQEIMETTSAWVILFFKLKYNHRHRLQMTLKSFLLDTRVLFCDPLNKWSVWKLVKWAGTTPPLLCNEGHHDIHFTLVGTLNTKAGGRGCVWGGVTYGNKVVPVKITLNRRM